MTYQDTVEWMFQQLPMYQQVGNKAYKVDLSNIQKLSAHLEEPHHKFKSIHVAGTNGKGSVSHMLASVFQEAGFKTGLYTSPHLRDFRERIKINGKEISEEAVIRFIQDNKVFLEGEQLSFFEMTVGMAYWEFARERVDIAVVEVGLGGRLDSTNIITPEISVITNIGYDHVQILGDTLAKIAAEKAGIIKKGVPVIISERHEETLPVFQRISAENEAPLYMAEGKYDVIPKSDLKGAYQHKNIAAVLQAVEVLEEQGWNLSTEAVNSGIRNVIRNTGLRGRWDVLQENPKVICDTAHNKEGLSYVLKQLSEEEFEHLHIVFGVVNDKDLDEILPLLPKSAEYYFCKPSIPRGMEALYLAEKAEDHYLSGRAFNSVSEAYKAALTKASKADVIYVGGSTFTVAEII